MWSSRGIKTNQFEFIVGPTTPEAIDDHGHFIWFYKLKHFVAQSKLFLTIICLKQPLKRLFVFISSEYDGKSLIGII